MASSVENKEQQAVSMELPAPSGWVKKVSLFISTFIYAFFYNLYTCPGSISALFEFSLMFFWVNLGSKFCGFFMCALV